MTATHMRPLVPLPVPCTSQPVSLARAGGKVLGSIDSAGQELDLGTTRQACSCVPKALQKRCAAPQLLAPAQPCTARPPRHLSAPSNQLPVQLPVRRRAHLLAGALVGTWCRSKAASAPRRPDCRCRPLYQLPQGWPCCRRTGEAAPAVSAAAVVPPTLPYGPVVCVPESPFFR